MKKTEKLESDVYNIVICERHNIDLGSHALTTRILQACKKAGLKFVEIVTPPSLQDPGADTYPVIHDIEFD